MVLAGRQTRTQTIRKQYAVAGNSSSLIEELTLKIMDEIELVNEKKRLKKWSGVRLGRTLNTMEISDFMEKVLKIH